MIRLTHTKRRHRLTIILDIPRFSKPKQWEQLRSRGLTALLLMSGLAGVAYGITPLFIQPEATAVTTNSTRDTAEIKTVPTTLPASLPVRVSIDAIDLTTELITTGKNPDGTLAVPDRYDVAAWYKHSPTPGELGPSIIVGHVDNYLGPAVFFSLRDVRPGATISITRQDGTNARFVVDRVALFDQDNFPTEEVYGNLDHAGLRLITCGGAFNPLTGYYLQNTVVYATLVTR